MRVYQTPAGNVIKAWTDGVEFEDAARAQVEACADMPFVAPWVAVMPDVHAGIGATVGSVIPMNDAVMPSAVGVDIGCGMIAGKFPMKVTDLDTAAIRKAIEAAVPCGRTDPRKGGRDKGAWGELSGDRDKAWLELFPGYDDVIKNLPSIDRGGKAPTWQHLGTLGTGNHFIEVCGDLNGDVWVVIHSGSRGPGNRIGSDYTRLAKELCAKWFVKLSSPDLAYLPRGTDEYDNYVAACQWAQEFALKNRELMFAEVSRILGKEPSEVVNCHHNYMSTESIGGKNLMIVRKGAVSARKGKLGIIPGSMGAKSYIVRGLGNEESFCSCSHGAGRRMSRTKAKASITIADHVKATAGVDCLKDESVLDESPAAYKDVDAVMAAQKDLVEVVYQLKQKICVKGTE